MAIIYLSQDKIIIPFNKFLKMNWLMIWGMYGKMVVCGGIGFVGLAEDNKFI